MGKCQKNNVAQLYAGYLKFTGKKWTLPKYTIEDELLFIPTARANVKY
jgi:hypothetical protein